MRVCGGSDKEAGERFTQWQGDALFFLYISSLLLYSLPRLLTYFRLVQTQEIMRWCGVDAVWRGKEEAMGREGKRRDGIGREGNEGEKRREEQRKEGKG